MMRERNIAGLRCSDVLEALPDFLEGILPSDRTRRVHEHLAGCDWCERFGGEYAGAVGALRRHILEQAESRPSPADVRARVRSAITGR